MIIVMSITSNWGTECSWQSFVNEPLNGTHFFPRMSSRTMFAARDRFTASVASSSWQDLLRELPTFYLATNNTFRPSLYASIWKVEVTVTWLKFYNSEGTLGYERLGGSQNSGVFKGTQRSVFKVWIELLWITSTSGYFWFSVVHSLLWTLKNQLKAILCELFDLA